MLDAFRFRFDTIKPSSATSNYTTTMTYRPHKHIPDKERVIAGYVVSRIAKQPSLLCKHLIVDTCV